MNMYDELYPWDEDLYQAAWKGGKLEYAIEPNFKLSRDPI